RVIEGPEMIEVTNEKVAVAKEKLKEARTRQKSYADKHRRSLEFQPGARIRFSVANLSLLLYNLTEQAHAKEVKLYTKLFFARATKTRFANLDIWEFLRSNPSTLGEDFFKARITENHFEIIAKEYKEHIVEKKIYVILPLQGEFASPEVKGSLDADEDIGVDDVCSAIDGIFNIGESNVESIEVRSKFGEFSENKASLEEVVVGGGKVLGVGEDDDLCNAATDEGDDTVESGDISILNSLIGHGNPRFLQLCGTIDTTEVLIDKEADKEVQYDVYTLRVLILFLKRLNDQYIKKKKMKAAMHRRLWDHGIKKKNVGITLRARKASHILFVIV
nr:class II heat shock protein [Tanacetum cinerariifolium]